MTTKKSILWKIKWVKIIEMWNVALVVFWLYSHYSNFLNMSEFGKKTWNFFPVIFWWRKCELLLGGRSCKNNVITFMGIYVQQEGPSSLPLWRVTVISYFLDDFISRTVSLHCVLLPANINTIFVRWLFCPHCYLGLWDPWFDTCYIHLAVFNQGRKPSSPLIPSINPNQNHQGKAYVYVRFYRRLGSN